MCSGIFLHIEILLLPWTTQNHSGIFSDITETMKSLRKYKSKQSSKSKYRHLFVTESFSTLKKEKQPPYNLNSGENRPYRKNSNGLTTPMNTANTSFSRFSCNYLAKNYRFTTQTISFHTKACSISFMISRINRGEIVREQNYYTPLLPFPN